MDANEMVRILRSNADVNPHAAAMTMAADLIESLQAKLAAEKRMADAALRDLKHMDNCDICAHGQAEVPGCDVECEGCKLDCACRDCRNEDNWQWRGPCAENRRKEK